MLNHSALELTAALDFDIRIIQLTGNATGTVYQNMVVADNIVRQKSMHINDFGFYLACHIAFGPDLQIGHVDFPLDGAIDAGSSRRMDGAGEKHAFSNDQTALGDLIGHVIPQ